MSEISLYLLAKQAKADGQMHLYWKYVRNHAYVMRKYFAKEKATVPAAAVSDNFDEIGW